MSEAKPTFYDCGCSHLKVRAGRCDVYDENGVERTERIAKAIDVRTLALADALDALAGCEADEERERAFEHVGRAFDNLRAVAGAAAITRLLPVAPAWRARAAALRKTVAFCEAVDESRPSEEREVFRAEMRAAHAEETRILTETDGAPTRPKDTPGDLLAAAIEALTRYEEISADEDATGEQTSAAHDLAVNALKRCAEAGAPVLRWLLVAADLDCLIGTIEHEMGRVAMDGWVTELLSGDGKAAPGHVEPSFWAWLDVSGENIAGATIRGVDPEQVALAFAEQRFNHTAHCPEVQKIHVRDTAGLVTHWVVTLEATGNFSARRAS